MRRRHFLAVVGLVIFPSPFAVRAQEAKRRPLIVWYGSGPPAAPRKFINALLDGLRELGDIEGQDFEMTYRFGDNRPELLPGLAAETISLKPAIIVAAAVDTAVEAKKLTSTIPVVSGALADAIHLGLVANYARPGGNVTGITPYLPDLPAKQMQIAREIVPGAAKIGLLGNLNDVKAVPQHEELVAAAEKLGVKVVSPEVRRIEDMKPAIQQMKDDSVDVVIVLQTTMTLSQRSWLGTYLEQQHLPALFGYREHIDEGGLISYGVDLGWCWHHLATQVHKILHGASPADLPVEFPPNVKLVINLGTAKRMGLTMSPVLLARADEVIE